MYTCHNLFRSEVWIVLKSYVIRSLNISYVSFSLPLIMFVMLSVYVSFIGDLTPRKVFVSLSLISYVRITSVHFFIMATLLLSEARVAWKRIKVCYLVLTVRKCSDTFLQPSWQAQSPPARLVLDHVTVHGSMYMHTPKCIINVCVLGSA